MPERQQYQFDREAQRRVARDLLDQKAASSRPGQVYHTMTSLQDRMARPGYTNMQADIDQLKGLRRDWNRNQKYTPQGMRVSGATSPLDAQNRFMGATETFRQGNKPAFNKMYPLTGGYMDISEKGGLWGALLSEIAGKTKKGIEDFGDYIGSGITSALAGDSEEDKAEYVARTFGPYPTDIHPGLPIDEEPLLVDEEPGLTRREQIEQVLEDPGIRTDAEFLLTPEKTEEELRREQLLKELEENMVWSDEPDDLERGLAPPEDVEPLPIMPPYDDPRTQSGISNLMPGGPLYDAIPMGQRLNMRIAEQMRERGPHANEPRTSYYGRNWYEEYKRKMENEMEVNRGIRSPMDR